MIPRIFTQNSFRVCEAPSHILLLVYFAMANTGDGSIAVILLNIEGPRLSMEHELY